MAESEGRDLEILASEERAEEGLGQLRTGPELQFSEGKDRPT